MLDTNVTLNVSIGLLLSLVLLGNAWILLFPPAPNIVRYIAGVSSIVLGILVLFAVV